MHELAVAAALVEIVRRHAGGRRVMAVDVTVGRLRQVVPASLHFAFRVVAAGTEAEGAVLRVEHAPVRVACRRCGFETVVETFPLVCAYCGEAAVDVRAGDEVVVESVEVEPVVELEGA